MALLIFFIMEHTIVTAMGAFNAYPNADDFCFFQVYGCLAHLSSGGISCRTIHILSASSPTKNRAAQAESVPQTKYPNIAYATKTQADIMRHTIITIRKTSIHLCSIIPRLSYGPSCVAPLVLALFD
jgi:hypothetical protein